MFPEALANTDYKRLYFRSHFDGALNSVTDVEGASVGKARWLRDLRRFLPLKSQFVLWGNVRDYHICEHAPGISAPAPLSDVLHAELHSAGYSNTLRYDPVNGFTSLSPEANESAEALMRAIGLTPSDGRAPAGLDLLTETLPRFVLHQGEPAALVIDFASRLLIRHDNLSDLEHRLFTRALIYSYAAVARPSGPSRQPFFNTIVWVVEKENGLPDWLMVDNPRMRLIPVAKPDNEARCTVAKALLQSMPDGHTATSVELAEAERAFVDQTDGLLLADMMAVTELGRAEGVQVSRIGDAVRRYKVGVTDDPWRKIPRDKIRNADSFIRSRVRGQDHAVTHVLDIIKRAITGVGAPGRGGRPRGVAFLAGPTGVGKTELAKTVSELLFGDDTAYLRFDMSEFSAEHADQRLIGAPPGYVGYDAGGELTNAIRERPFRP